MSKIAFEIIAEESSFSALAPAWRTLTAPRSSLQIHQSFDWQWRAWQHVGRPLGRKLRIVVGRVADEVVLIWPLVLDGDYLMFLSCEQTEYRDVIVVQDARSEGWVDSAWAFVTAMPGANCLVLYDVRADARLAAVVARRAPRGHRRVERRTFLIDLAQWSGWDAYWAARPKRLVADQRRQWRRVAERTDEIGFHAAVSAAEAEAWLDWFFAEKLGWMDSRDISTRNFGSSEYRAFVRATTQDALQRDALLVGRLGSAETTLSVGFGYAYGGNFIFQSFAYNPADRALSPSRLLLEHLLRCCFARGIAVFDFLPGEADYKTQWSDRTLAVTDYLVPLTLLGRAKLAWHTGGMARLARASWVRAQFARLPAGLQARLRRALGANWDYGAEIRRPEDN